MPVDKFNIILARKPLSEKSVAENVLKHGTGGINIDGSRIGTEDGKSKVIETIDRKQSTNGWNTKYVITDDEPRGRFPANIIFDEEAGQLLDQQSGISKSTDQPRNNKKPQSIYGNGKGIPPQTSNGFSDKGGASRYFMNIKND